MRDILAQRFEQEVRFKVLFRIPRSQKVDFLGRRLAQKRHTELFANPVPSPISESHPGTLTIFTLSCPESLSLHGPQLPTLDPQPQAFRTA